MIPTVTDDLIREIEEAATACGHGWYETVGDTADLFPDQDSDTVYVHLLRPELTLQLIQRLRSVEARLSSLAVAVTGPNRQQALTEAGAALDYLAKSREAA